MTTGSARDFAGAVDESLTTPPPHLELAAQVLAGTSARPVYVLGRNSEALNVAAHIRLNGLVDDAGTPGAEWRGLPIVHGEAVPREAIVINTSTSIAPHDAAARLRALGLTGVPVAALIAASDGALRWPDFVTEQRQSWASRRDEWVALHEELADPTSKQTLLDLLRFRLTADARYTAGYRVRFKDQYFEDFLGLSEERFVDAGAFDGDTTEEFCRRYPDYREVYLYEPSADNLARARARLADVPRLTFIKQGLSDAAGWLEFDAGLGSASTIVSSGGEKIEVTTLDASAPAPPTFIKMDLEGWEQKALVGSRALISANRPKLAIAVYHRADDFLDTAKLLHSMRKDYRLRLRHYTQGWSETVMYFS